MRHNGKLELADHGQHQGKCSKLQKELFGGVHLQIEIKIRDGHGAKKPQDRAKAKVGAGGGMAPKSDHDEIYGTANGRDNAEQVKNNGPCERGADGGRQKRDRATRRSEA